MAQVRSVRPGTIERSAREQYVLKLKKWPLPQSSANYPLEDAILDAIGDAAFGPLRAVHDRPDPFNKLFVTVGLMEGDKVVAVREKRHYPLQRKGLAGTWRTVTRSNCLVEDSNPFRLSTIVLCQGKQH